MDIRALDIEGFEYKGDLDYWDMAFGMRRLECIICNVEFGMWYLRCGIWKMALHDKSNCIPL